MQRQAAERFGERKQPETCRLIMRIALHGALWSNMGPTRGSPSRLRGFPQADPVTNFWLIQLRILTSYSAIFEPLLISVRDSAAA